MPTHFGDTPEALLGRNDSKNPATTCKGITGSGRPCRRALAISKVLNAAGGRRASPGLNGVVAIVAEDGVIEEADFYCWQHKDQAAGNLQQQQTTNHALRPGKRISTELFPLQERSSIDTLVQRLGIDAETSQKHRRRRNEGTQETRLDGSGAFTEQKSRPQKSRPSRPNKKKVGFWESLCCMGTQDDDDYYEIVRHRRRTNPPPQMTTPANQNMVQLNNTSTLPIRPAATSQPSRPSLSTSTLPPAPHRRQSQTSQLLSLIPASTSPETTSALLAELSKPLLRPHDDDAEAGYIYIFWLTPESAAAAASARAAETARALLAPPAARPRHLRRLSDAMTEFSYDGTIGATSRAVGPGGGDAHHKHSAAAGTTTIMLKIGRANNVTRRMHEWQRQCGYELNLVRWYPHVPSSSSASSTSPSPHHSPQTSPDRRRGPAPATAAPQRRESAAPPSPPQQQGFVRKVPFVKRVERLIHLELAARQVRRQCAACGREHREWFEVGASEAGVRTVDECVKRWVGWAEREAAPAAAAGRG